MALPDASLGIPIAFDSPQFRNAIKFSMQMGKPNLAGRAAVFIIESHEVQYFLNDVEQFPPPGGDLKLDRDGKPLNPRVKMVRTADEEIPDVDCAIEIEDVSSEELPVGLNVRPVRATVTLLDVDYAKIVGVREMRYNADVYVFSHEPEDNGLFDVDVHTMIFFGKDES